MPLPGRCRLNRKCVFSPNFLHRTTAPETNSWSQFKVGHSPLPCFVCSSHTQRPAASHPQRLRRSSLSSRPIALRVAASPTSPFSANKNHPDKYTRQHSMSFSNVLATRDVNASMAAQSQAGAETDAKPDVMSMEHHRQVLQSKMEQGEYVTLLFPDQSLHSLLASPMLTPTLQEQDLHLPVGQYHEPMHGQAQRLPQQAGRQVREPPGLSLVK